MKNFLLTKRSGNQGSLRQTLFPFALFLAIIIPGWLVVLAFHLFADRLELLRPGFKTLEALIRSGLILGTLLFLVCWPIRVARTFLGPDLTEPAETLLLGILLIVLACAFLYSVCGNPLDELALIRRAQVTIGSLLETYEDENEDSRGRVYFSDVGVYTYRPRDGREFKTTMHAPTGQLRAQEQVEYLSDNPAVSRIKSSGCQSVFEWLWRKIGLGSLLLAMFLAPGVALAKNGIVEMKRFQKGLPHKRSG